MEKSDKNRQKPHGSSIKTGNSSDKYLHYLILSGIIILTLIVYSRTFRNGFTTWDDKINITDNKDIHDLSISGIIKIFSSFYIDTYKPLTILTFSLIYHFFGLNPIAFHSVNVIFHLLNIILVYLFIYQLLAISYQQKAINDNFKKIRIQIATFVTLFFAIHPMNAETVCWISGLDNSLYSFYYLASLIFYLKYVQSNTQDTCIKTQEKHKYEVRFKIFNFVNKNYLFSLLLFMFSLLSKPMAVTIPIILFLLDYYTCRKFKSKPIIDKIPFFLLALVFGIISIISSRFTFSTTNNILTTDYSLFNRFFILTYSVSFYIINLVAPFKLSAIHPPPEVIQGFLPLKYYLSPILIILIIFVIIRISRIKTNYTNQMNYPNRRKEIIFGTLFFVITISIALMASKVRYYQLAERYTYLPYLGLFIIIGHELYNFKQIRRRYVNIVVVMFLVIYSFISYQRSKVWANDITLWNDVTEKYSNVYLAFNNRGFVKTNIKDYNGAMEDFDKAIAIYPNFDLAYCNRGWLKTIIFDYEGAKQDLNKAILLNPKYAMSYNNMGWAKANLGDYNGAKEDFDKGIALNSDFEEAYLNRGWLKGKMNDFKGALEDFNKVIDINPHYALAFYNRGEVKNGLGDKEGACLDWRKAGELGYKEAYENIKKYCK